ncbi:hypothetical protein OEG92_05580 [Polaribacter sejongensis]
MKTRVKSRMILSLKKEIKERDVKIKLLEKKGSNAESNSIT